MEKIINGKPYEFLPDSENPEHDGCYGCAFRCDFWCLDAGYDCVYVGGIWKLKPGDKPEITKEGES